MKTFLSLTLVLAVAILGTAEDKKPEKKPDTSGMTIGEAAVGDKELSTFADAIKEAELTDTFKVDGPITVFAPTNAAFEKLGKETLGHLHADKKKLAAVVLCHVMKGKVTADDVAKLKGKELETVGGRYPVRMKDDKWTVGTATITTADVACKNGIIHVIDEVLKPDEIK